MSGDFKVVAIGGGDFEIIPEIEMADGIRVPFTVTATGPTTIYSPATGKAIRLISVFALNDPDASDSADISVHLGGEEILRGYAIQSGRARTGPADGVLSIGLSNTSSVSGTAIIQEVDP